MDKIKSIIQWLDRNLPVKADCGHWAKKKDLENLGHQWAGWISVCPACYDKQHAWDKGVQ